MILSKQQRIAYIRAILQAIGSGALAVLLSYQLHSVWGDALITGGIVALSALGIRGTIEGMVDTRRARARDAPP